MDRFLRTSDPFIYAAGDACAFEQVSGPRMRLECWKNAEDQGTLAGRNMLGSDEAYVPLPWMWSDQFDRTMQIAGQAGGSAEDVRRRCPDGTLLIYHLDKDQMILGISGFGSIREVSRGGPDGSTPHGKGNPAWKKGAGGSRIRPAVTRQGGRGLKSAAPKERGRTLWTCIVKSGVGNVGR